MSPVLCEIIQVPCEIIPSDYENLTSAERVSDLVNHECIHV